MPNNTKTRKGGVSGEFCPVVAIRVVASRAQAYFSDDEVGVGGGEAGKGREIPGGILVTARGGRREGEGRDVK